MQVAKLLDEETEVLRVELNEIRTKEAKSKRDLEAKLAMKKEHAENI